MKTKVNTSVYHTVESKEALTNAKKQGVKFKVHEFNQLVALDLLKVTTDDNKDLNRLIDLMSVHNIISNDSLLVDFKILIYTVMIVVKGSGK